MGPWRRDVGYKRGRGGGALGEAREPLPEAEGANSGRLWVLRVPLAPASPRLRPPHPSPISPLLPIALHGGAKEARDIEAGAPHERFSPQKPCTCLGAPHWEFAPTIATFARVLSPSHLTALNPSHVRVTCPRSSPFTSPFYLFHTVNGSFSMLCELLLSTVHQVSSNEENLATWQSCMQLLTCLDHYIHFKV